MNFPDNSILGKYCDQSCVRVTTPDFLKHFIPLFQLNPALEGAMKTSMTHPYVYAILNAQSMLHAVKILWTFVA